MIAAAWICLFSPLAAALADHARGNRLSRRGAGYLATLSVAVSFVAAIVAFVGLLGDSPDERYHPRRSGRWLTAGQLDFGLRILVDPLSVFMMLSSPASACLIVLYSIGYMDGDDEERRYFAYMALFVFSMLLLVQGGNLLILLVGWGLVGLSSYLLIGFWHERPDRGRRRQEGVRDERDRRRDDGARALPADPAHGLARLRGVFYAGRLARPLGRRT